MKTRLVIVDDHHLIRLGIRMTLMPFPEKYEIIGEASSAEELLELLDNGVVPELILLDIIMPGMNGTEAVRLIHGRYPDIMILVISSDVSAHTIRELMKMNVDGFISKNYTEDELTVAIDDVVGGLSYFGRDISRIICDIRLSNKGITDDMFSERELEIIDLCKKGLTAKEISARLSISPRTVSNHKTIIFSKMGIHSNYEMIEYAISHGIIS